MAIDNSNGGDIITSMICGGDACVGHLQVILLFLKKIKFDKLIFFLEIEEVPVSDQRMHLHQISY